MSTSDLRPSNRPLPLPHPRRVCRVANYPAGPANCGILIQTLSSPLSSPPSNPNPSTPISCTQAYTLQLIYGSSCIQCILCTHPSSLSVPDSVLYACHACQNMISRSEVGWFSNLSHSYRKSVEVGSPTELPCLIGNMRAANKDSLKFKAIFMNLHQELPWPKLNSKCYKVLLLGRCSFILIHGKLVIPNHTFPLKRSNKIKTNQQC